MHLTSGAFTADGCNGGTVRFRGKPEVQGFVTLRPKLIRTARYWIDYPMGYELVVTLAYGHRVSVQVDGNAASADDLTSKVQTCA